MDVREVTTAEDVVLLDVRERDEWRAGHIEGVLHVPMGELAVRQAEIPQDTRIVCVCTSGQRSGAVASALARAGYDAHNLDGGMLAWVEARLPVVDEDGAEGRLV